jgi:hypothetical protein
LTRGGLIVATVEGGVFLLFVRSGLDVATTAAKMNRNAALHGAKMKDAVCVAAGIAHCAVPFTVVSSWGEDCGLMPLVVAAGCDAEYSNALKKNLYVTSEIARY